MKLMKTEEAVGQILCHDITQIIPGVTKDAVFRKGILSERRRCPGLIKCRKRSYLYMGKQRNMLHENDAAEVLYRCAKMKICVRQM